MIYKVFATDEFAQATQTLGQMLADMPTYALDLSKKLLNASFNNALEHQLSLEHSYQLMASQSEDYKEGVNAFLEKRKPTFLGK